MKLDELITKRRKQTEFIHELTFYATLALTVMFFWALGGSSLLWNIILASFGAVLDFNKKNQLELAAVTQERRERNIRKFVALMLSIFTLLSGLGAALNRTLIVTQEESNSVDFTAIDAEISDWQAELNLQITQENTATRIEWRDNAHANAEAAREKLKNLRDERKVMTSTVSKKEKVGDMFSLLARFFGFGEDSGRFMVVLLMFAQGAMELSIWMTTPQYWKDSGKTAIPTPAQQPKQGTGRESLPVERPLARKTTPVSAMADKASQKGDTEVRGLSESNLRVQTSAQAKKVSTDYGLSLFEDEINGK